MTRQLAIRAGSNRHPVKVFRQSTRSLDSVAPLTERITTVIFCDLRGFSGIVEQSDDLLGTYLLVDAALNAMAEAIERNDGQISDVQGDAVLGYWNDDNAVVPGAIAACRTATEIMEAFRDGNDGTSSSMTYGFEPAIGISSGRALCGSMKVGMHEKKGVFGPVACIGSRLQGLTKRLGVSTLIDGTTVRRLAEFEAAAEFPNHLCGSFRMCGLDQPVAVHRLLSSTADESDSVHLSLMDRAVSCFANGDWPAARAYFQTCESLGPELRDPVCNYLLDLMATYGDVPSADWDGVIEASQK